jgi:hypothetical protein
MPTSYRIDPAAAEVVKLLDAPRVVTALDETDAESLHVLYVERGQVRSMLLSDWTGTRPPDYDPAEDLTAAIAAHQAREVQQRADAAALRMRILTTAHSAVGQPIDTLTAVQVRALLVCLLHRAGAIDTSGVVRPLGEWLG